jgi:hypothetical protein
MRPVWPSKVASMEPSCRQLFLPFDWVLHEPVAAEYPERAPIQFLSWLKYVVEPPPPMMVFPSIYEVTVKVPEPGAGAAPTDNGLTKKAVAKQTSHAKPFIGPPPSRDLPAEPFTVGKAPRAVSRRLGELTVVTGSELGNKGWEARWI